MKKNGIKTVGYIGFSDAWGDLVYDSLMKAAEPAGIKVLTNERYARSDQSVTGQALKVVAARPDAVITGGSGTPGALPYLALAERGYKGPIFGTHALINPDFVRVGGPAVDGLLAPTGPVIVAEQLPASNPIRKVSMDVPRGLPEGQRRAADRRVLGLCVRRLADLRRRRPARAGRQGRARHAAVPGRAARRDRHDEGAGRHARRLQLQARQPLRLGRARARRRQAREGPVEAGAVTRSGRADAARRGRPAQRGPRARRGGPGPPRPLPQRRAVRARAAALLRDHLELPRPREPGAGAGRLPDGRDRRPPAGDGAPARRRDPRAVQPLRAQGHAARQRGERATSAATSAARTTRGPIGSTARRWACR